MGSVVYVCGVVIVNGWSEDVDRLWLRKVIDFFFFGVRGLAASCRLGTDVAGLNLENEEDVELIVMALGLVFEVVRVGIGGSNHSGASGTAASLSILGCGCCC